MNVRRLFRAALGVALVMTSLAASAQPIKLGELNSYKVFPAFLEPYKKGMDLALDEVNAAGGVLGRPLEIVSRDDTGSPGDAVRVAEELISREKVVLLMGTFASNVGLAVADLAKQRQVLFLAAEPLTDKIVWENGNKYTFRLRASTYMQTAMLVPEAAKLGKKRWAIVYPNYEYGQAATTAFKKQMIALQPGGIEFVEQAVPLGKIDAGPVVQALMDAKPDAIFSSLFGADLARFVREGQLRGLFKDRPVFNLLGGEPEYLDPLKDEAPVGWWVTGYPWYAIDTRRAQALPGRVSGEIQGLSAPRLGGRLQHGQGRGRRPSQGRFDRYRKARGRHERPRVRFAVRPRHVPRARPSIDDGRLRRPHHGEGRQRRDDRLALRRRQGLPALRRHREAPAPVAAVERMRNPGGCGNEAPAPGFAALNPGYASPHPGTG